MWDTFVTEFCKVEFVCFAGEPNWLGWVALGFGTLFVLGLVLSILGAIVS